MISNDLKRQLVLDDIDPLECNNFEVHKRDGSTAPFDAARIKVAISKAFKAEQKLADDAFLDIETQQAVEQVTEEVMKEVISRAVQGESLKIELIQDAVENRLMANGHYQVARGFIVYRENRRKARLIEEGTEEEINQSISVRLPDGSSEPLDAQRIRRVLVKACTGLEDRCNAHDIAAEVLKTLFNGISPSEIESAILLNTKSRIEKEPAHSFVAARLLLNKNYKDVWNKDVAPYEFDKTYRDGLKSYLEVGIENDLISQQLMQYDLVKLGKALKPERDEQFNYLGLQTLYDRYFIHLNKRRLETPQYMFMRVAMGLALKEGEKKNERAIEFYDLLSSFRFMSSTPTLFNSGTQHSQLSSCYLLTIDDDLGHIFKTISDDAQLSKWAGGLGNDWTNVRATGSHIKGTNGESQGVIPFLKVANDTAVAVNQGGKRKGAMCAYLETWHLDIEDFLELRKNTGDERRRTHDMHTANWIPDLFMKRVKENAEWTLFSPSDTPDLHDAYGKDFEEKYEAYEAKAASGELKLFKKIEAIDLWRRMLTMVFETGHPWITFKDPSNIRSPQQHAGVVHSSNLCTEILLNTSNEEAAVCNLGSVNLVRHIKDGKIDAELIEETVSIAMRMLDNVVDINFYPTAETANSNYKHRPVGLGIMGFQDALYRCGIPYDSEEGVTFADNMMEHISYHAVLGSSKLAKEKGPYDSYRGSLWSQGILPIDSIKMLQEERGGHLTMDTSSTLDWDFVREHIENYGMRNSNCMAIAPTATIANITGVSQSIEPNYKHLFVKSNLSGEFTVVNPYLVEDLKKVGLWDDDMIEDLKYYDGSIQEIERIPQHIRDTYKCAFEISPEWILECASRRQKWIDMGQSLNLYIEAPSGRQLNDMYMAAWEKGLKTTYYLRALSATQVEKSTVDINKRGLQPRWMKNQSAAGNLQVKRDDAPEQRGSDDDITQGAAMEVPSACSLDNPDCESCQ